MQTVPLTVAARSTDKKAKDLLKESHVPCVLYGNDVENTPLQAVYNEIHKAYATAGASTIVELDIGGKKVPVLFHSLTFDPVSDRITHVDFYAVDMKKEIEARVPIRFEGESLAVKEEGGVMVTARDSVTVICLPSDLPSELIVSIESLVQFGDTLTVAAIVVPKGVTIKQEPDSVIATVQEPRKEEEIVPEVVEGEEGEEGELAEGEEPAEGEEGEKKEGEGEEKKEGEGEEKKKADKKE